MKVVNINTEKNKHRKEDLLEVLDEMRAQVESGEIQEFVATSLNADGETQIHVSCLDFPAGVGLYEVGKMMFVHQIQIGNE